MEKLSAGESEPDLFFVFSAPARAAGDQGERQDTYAACPRRLCVFVPERRCLHLDPLAPCRGEEKKKNNQKKQFVSPYHFTNEISAVRRWINIIRKARVGH